MDIPGLGFWGIGAILQSLGAVRKVGQQVASTRHTHLRHCKIVPQPTAMISQVYIDTGVQPIKYTCMCDTSICIRTAWNDLYDHSQNNALALVSLTDLRLKYQQLLFGLTTFCLFKGASLGTELKVPRYPFTQVPKLKVSQLRDICHKFTAATARCQKHLRHHHDQHQGGDQDGGREGQSRHWRKPSFLLSSLSITVLLGTKNWAPSNTSQIPISTASVLVSDFRVGSFLELNICLGAQDGDIPQACPTPDGENK